MARVVVQRAEVKGADGTVSEGRLRAGEVIDVLPDGASLGKRGDTHPDWLVIEMPGVSPEKLAWLLAQHNDDELAAIAEAKQKGESVAPTARLRAWRFSKDALAGKGMEAFKANPTKQAAAALVEATAAPTHSLDAKAKAHADR